MSGKRQYFGTDGVRGVANRHPMTPEFVMRLGQAAAQVLGKGSGQNGDRPRCVIGRDTRGSGEMLETALASGLCSAGIDVVFAGIVPTPAVALLTVETEAAFGAVVSASHNPFEDNGIKLINGDGYKLTDEQELAIEALISAEVTLVNRPEAHGLGRISALPDAADRFVEHAIASMEGVRLEGMKVVLDNAHGAAFQTSTHALTLLGADVQAHYSEPNGVNINADCGCTHPEFLQKLMQGTGAHVGVAHDGDADRLALCDETGSVLFGDELIAIAALDMLNRGTLKDKTLIVTTMSNFGLDALINSVGAKIIRTDVGDRYVIAKMRELNTNFGGEESGHVVFRDHATTGDGLIAALQILKIMAQTGKPLSELRKCITLFPQAKRYLKVKSKPPLVELVAANKLIDETNAGLNGEGRVLLRYSGTESIIRLLIEGRSSEYIEAQASKIAEALIAQIG